MAAVKKEVFSNSHSYFTWSYVTAKCFHQVLFIFLQLVNKAESLIIYYVQQSIYLLAGFINAVSRIFAHKVDFIECRMWSFQWSWQVSNNKISNNLALQGAIWTISVGIGNLLMVERGGGKHVIYKKLLNFL